MSNTSFDKIIDKVFDGFKKITPALVAVAIMSGLILFLPSFILSKLGLNNLSESIKTIIGLLFILSCSLIVTILCSIFFQKVVKSIKHNILLNKLRKSYIKLSPIQKKIIAKLMNSSTKSIELDSLSGDTLYLREHNFIYRPQQLVDAFDVYNNKYNYVPQLWLIDLFQKEPELFNVDNGKEIK